MKVRLVRHSSRQRHGRSTETTDGIRVLVVDVVVVHVLPHAIPLDPAIVAVTHIELTVVNELAVFAIGAIHAEAVNGVSIER